MHFVCRPVLVLPISPFRRHADNGSRSQPSLYVSTALAVTFPSTLLWELYLYGINMFWDIMHTVKRIEIIRIHLSWENFRCLKKKAGVPGHIVIRECCWGFRGTKIWTWHNVYIIAFVHQKRNCYRNHATTNKFGGACYVSDAWNSLWDAASIWDNCFYALAHLKQSKSIKSKRNLCFKFLI